ncbi:chitobiase/beta-hexosaminidase C-terminal domain-containing protein [Luteolibacter algae]|uniref:Chitobiase/beta-hexosaminidase C-terminal domain-containing protein n=1 Tax=Luteolibacter algae TaxID=454151 RepID=A0ABW5D3Z0_9BACT
MGSDPDVADGGAETILLVIPQPERNHNGGQLAFGPDGLLYISTGDGGGSGDPYQNSQNLTNRLGKILRIDVENTSPGLPYSIPATNPFATHNVNSREILCWGLRNPWRFSFDSLTGDVFIGDVGEHQREEIDFIPSASINAGINFGWSVKEGTLDFSVQQEITGALVPPVFEYDHTLGSSVTGGQTYRGSDPRLQGFYIFGDFQTGRIWGMENPAAGGRVALLKDTAYNISTFGKDEAGEIYFADYESERIFRISTADTLPPPLITPPTSTHIGGVSYTIGNDVPGAVTHYTTDGSTPDESSPVFTPGIWVHANDPLTLKAISLRPDLEPSPASEAVYTLRPNGVQISGGNGYLNDYSTIELSESTPGTTIRYTIDGSLPDENSPLYSAESGIPINRSLTLSAIAFKSGSGWLASSVTAKTFRLIVDPPVLSSTWSDLYDPIGLTSKTSGAVLHYTTDGTMPTLQSPVWTGPQELPSNTVIRVLAGKGQMETASASLKVLRISAQKVRFETIGTGYLSSVADVVRKDDSTLYAVGLHNIWKISGGESTLYHTGGYTQSFQSIALTPEGKLSVGDAGTRDVIHFLPPSSVASDRWEVNSIVPADLVSLPSGGFLVADSTGNRIQRITASHVGTPFAGSGTAESVDGPALQAGFNFPVGIARDDAGIVYVAEYSGRRIRRIGVDNIVTTVAGNGEPGWVDGPISTARFDRPRALALDRIGNLYVSDEASGSTGKIRKIRPDGTVTTLRGPKFQAGTDTVLSPDSLGLSSPRGLDVDENGVLYIAGDYTVIKAIQEDWDNDGIPDTTEAALGAPFVVGIDDRSADFDGDLFSNCSEWIAGTDPLLSESRPNGATLETFSDKTISLDFPCDPGSTHQLEYSDDLQNWRPMGIPSSSALRSFPVRLTGSSLTSQRFYRLKSTSEQP